MIIQLYLTGRVHFCNISTPWGALWFYTVTHCCHYKSNQGKHPWCHHFPHARYHFAIEWMGGPCLPIAKAWLELATLDRIVPTKSTLQYLFLIVAYNFSLPWFGGQVAYGALAINLGNIPAQVHILSISGVFLFVHFNTFHSLGGLRAFRKHFGI